MDNDLRVGIEVEMQNLKFSFAKPAGAGHQFWTVPAGTDVETTMIRNQPILVPIEPAGGFAQLETIDWKGDWGFIISGDGFTVQGGIGACHFELNCSAAPIQQERHHIFLRRAMKEFRDSINELQVRHSSPDIVAGGWRNIEKLYEIYNAKIQALSALPIAAGINLNRWKLQLSPAMAHLATPGGADGGNWKGYIALTGLTRDCDAQVNYQVDLMCISDRINDWLAVWDHLVVWKLTQLNEENMGNPTGYDKDDYGYNRLREGILWPTVYRNGMQLGLWKAAKQSAEVFVNTHPEPFQSHVGTTADALARFKKHCVALITIIFAMSAIVPIQEICGGTLKNGYSQLPKTSIASIALRICEVLGHDDGATRLRRYMGEGIANAALLVVKNLRRIETLRPFLPNAMAANSPDFLPNYQQNADRELFEADGAPVRLTAELQEGFKVMWNTTFSVLDGGHIIDANGRDIGYSTAAPFRCRWALANTSKAAERYGAGGNSIKILFESRCGINRLNFGYNPDVSSEFFLLAYKKLLKMDGLADGAITLKEHQLLQSGEAGTSDSVKKVQSELDAAQRNNLLTKVFGLHGWYH